MKNIFLIIVTLLLFTSLSVSAQVRVTGHVFAEVIEPVSLNGEYNSQSTLTSQNQNQNFGHFTMNDHNLASSILIDNKVMVTNENKQSLELVTTTAQHSNQSKKVDLQFSSNQNDFKQKNSVYSGKMNIVVAYN